MVKTRKKMYKTNYKIKKYLKEKGFHNFYLFPHLRFQKDYLFEGCSFDAFAWKKGDNKLWLFQFKTNKACPKKELKKYEKIRKDYSCIPCWVSYFDRKTKKYKGVVMWF